MHFQFLVLIVGQVLATCPLVETLYNTSNCCSDEEGSVPADLLAKFVTDISQEQSSNWNPTNILPTYNSSKMLLHYKMKATEYKYNGETIFKKYIAAVVADDPADYDIGTYTPGIGPLYQSAGHNVSWFRPLNSISDFQSVGPFPAPLPQVLFMHTYMLFILDGGCYAKFEGSGLDIEKDINGYIVGRMTMFASCTQEQKDLLAKPFVWILTYASSADPSYIEVAGYEWTNSKEMLPYPLGNTGVMIDVDAPLGPFYV